jgi:CelD/BcsL family acetyltransferase involved in cellulose biosynthesis
VPERDDFVAAAGVDFARAACCSDGMTRVDAVAVDHPEWARFVAAHPDATCFHSPAWAQLIASCYRFRAMAVVQRADDGSVVAGLPLVEVPGPLRRRRRWVCLPFTDECGPLVAGTGSATELLGEADELRRRAGVADLVVRDAVDVPGLASRQVAVTHRLDLRPDGDAAPPRPRPSVRRAVAAADRAGVAVRFGRSREDLVDRFYRLHVVTRRRQGVPVQPRRYFQLLWESMIRTGQGVVALAALDGRDVAGAVFLVGGRTVTYKYGASDERFWSVRPNHAVMARALEWAAAGGAARVDLGRSDLDNPGLIRFKETWGAVGRSLAYASTQHDASYGGARRAREALSVVIRRSPPITCRALGEVLYRYAA